MNKSWDYRNAYPATNDFMDAIMYRLWFQLDWFLTCQYVVETKGYAAEHTNRFLCNRTYKQLIYDTQHTSITLSISFPIKKIPYMALNKYNQLEFTKSSPNSLFSVFTYNWKMSLPVKWQELV